MQLFRMYSVLSVILLVDVCIANVPSIYGESLSSNTNENDIQENSVPNFSVTENEFTKFRIEYIKNQILKKLRLKEKPNIALTGLPKPVKEYEHFCQCRI
ncbi:hypothetical protein JTB14_038118 [Gonioctena quinquepunctata]|nr:hypothetical protein JTB14_038118 [Gonioctena quinquepunctata]